MEKRPHRRRQYIIRKKFQLKYIGIILGVMLISALVAGYTIYYNLWVLLGAKLANVYPQGRLVQIFRSVNISLAINMFFASILCIAIGILVSHRVAGPVYRMIKFLDNITSGNYRERLRLRKKDDLKDLAEAINRLVDKLEKEKKA